MIFRVRFIVPSPQVREQSPKLLHSETRQSVGQHDCPRTAQSPVSIKFGHGSPPHAFVCITTRDRQRVCDTPHVAEHSDQLPQSPTTQPRGQQPILQRTCSRVGGQGSPSCDGIASTARVRDCLPTPQLTSQSDHRDHVWTVQSVGHSCTLQVFTSTSDPQPWPPWTAPLITCRRRSCLPPPHVLSQMDQLPHTVR